MIIRVLKKYNVAKNFPIFFKEDGHLVLTNSERAPQVAS